MEQKLMRSKAKLVAVAAALAAVVLIGFSGPAEAASRWVCKTNSAGTVCGRHLNGKIYAIFIAPKDHKVYGHLSISTGKKNRIYKRGKHQAVERGKAIRLIWNHACRTQFRVSWYFSSGDPDPIDLRTGTVRC
ncbi:hypothetical protein [Nonomuraea sp. CA-141351]|uniref:hypothetical protein n=1 Tax=Nonomuraea sp. CA-141351 TaxID=3239996 RepID=UPI003D89ED25